MANTLRFLCIGDVVGQPGMTIFQRWVPKLKEQYAIDAIIVNGENAAKNGKGITPKIIDFFKHHDVAVITTGNHVWEQREIYASLEERDDILRPANYPPGCPGKGLTFFTIKNHVVAVANLHGRVFVRDLLDCPFRAIESLLTFITTKTNIVLVDFHAEATSEKNAMGVFLDGQVSCVYGTHTHVQTSDERILPQGTGFITDIGACNALNSIIGMQYETVINHFLYHPRMGRFEVEVKGPIVLSGIWLEVDADSGKTLKIERIRIVDETVSQSIDAT